MNCQKLTPKNTSNLTNIKNTPFCENKESQSHRKDFSKKYNDREMRVDDRYMQKSKVQLNIARYGSL